jgi:serine/threonine protein kinase
VALKIVDNIQDCNPLVLQYILREVTIIRQLQTQNPNQTAIVRLLEGFTRTVTVSTNPPSKKQQLILVFEHYPMTLLGWINSKQEAGNLTLSEIKKIFYECLRVLNYLQSANVMHRDIKADNILVNPDTLEVRLIDFNWSRPDPNRPHNDFFTCTSLDDKRTASKLVQDISLSLPQRPLTPKVQVPQYRAPEIAINNGRYNKAIDTWSMGCIFAELIAFYHSQQLREENTS